MRLATNGQNNRAINIKLRLTPDANWLTPSLLSGWVKVALFYTSSKALFWHWHLITGGGSILNKQGIYKVYLHLYHAIENTANQNAGKLLYIGWYSIEPFHQSLQFNGITPNLPIVHRIDYVRLCIFYDMV